MLKEMSSPVVKIGIAGSPAHCRLLRDALKEAEHVAVIDDGAKFSEVDILFWISGPGPLLSKHPRLWIGTKPFLVMYWIGSDVLFCLNRPKKILHRVSRYVRNLLFKLRVRRKSMIHLACAPWLVEELSRVGILARNLSITTIDAKRLRNPDHLRNRDIDFLSYVPLGRFSFYGGDKIIRMAEILSGCSFVIVMPNVTEIDAVNLPEHPGNVVFIPKVNFEEMQEFYLRSKCFLRFTIHDGMSLSVLEALFFKLQVFWTYSFPHVYNINNIGDLPTALRQVVTDYQPNEQGHCYVTENFSFQSWSAYLVSLINEICGFRGDNGGG